MSDEWEAAVDALDRAVGHVEDGRACLEGDAEMFAALALRDDLRRLIRQARSLALLAGVDPADVEVGQ